MNEIIARLLDWCHEHDYEVHIDVSLKDKHFPCFFRNVTVTLSRNGCSVRHIFNLDKFSENENLYPSTKWFDAGLDYELQSFLDYAENRFSEYEAEVNEENDETRKTTD